MLSCHSLKTLIVKFAKNGVQENLRVQIGLSALKRPNLRRYLLFHPATKAGNFCFKSFYDGAGQECHSRHQSSFCRRVLLVAHCAPPHLTKGKHAFRVLASR